MSASRELCGTGLERVSEIVNSRRWHADPTYLSGASDTKRGQQGVGAFSAMRGEDALDEGDDVGAVEDIELGGIFIEDVGEGELLDGAAAFGGRAEVDVRRGRRGSTGGRGLDGDEALVGGGTSRRRSETEIDLEEAV